MTTDFRALCAELANELDNIWQCLMDNRRLLHPLANDARTALATPPPEPPKPPTDEELGEFVELDEFVVFWWGAYTDESTVTDVIEDGNMAAFTRAVLERWGK